LSLQTLSGSPYTNFYLLFTFEVLNILLFEIFLIRLVDLVFFLIKRNEEGFWEGYGSFAEDNWNISRSYLGSECAFRCHFFTVSLYDEVAIISDIVIIFH
jgi:hypothetical protein